MKLFVGVTDRDWFAQLHASHASEVNFWKPGAPTNWRAIEVGGLFLFKLRGAPHVIAGGAHFLRYAKMPTSVAWQIFGRNNGRKSKTEFKEIIAQLSGNQAPDPPVGCIILTQPFFFDREDWIPIPDWQISGPGMSLDTSVGDGARIWALVRDRLNYVNWEDVSEYERFREQTIMQRVGQEGFRALVMDAYDRRCAISGERTLPVLQASHIRPYSEQGTHLVSNGLFLRSDIHTLFDGGYITVTPEFHVEVSGRIRLEYENGRDYYKLHGQHLISLPEVEALRPSRDQLIWHNENRFSP